MLDELQQNPLFKGVRHILDMEEPTWITRDDVHKGLGILEQRGIPFDLLLRQVYFRLDTRKGKELYELIPVLDLTNYYLL